MEKIYQVTAANGLRLRASAPDGAILTVLPYNTEIVFLKKADIKGWYKVEAQVGHEAEIGFVSSHFLMELAPKPKFKIPFLNNLDASYERVQRFAGTVVDQYGKDLLPKLNEILSEYKINKNPRRFAHFMAQLAHESAHFARLEENLNYSGKGLWNVFRKYFDNLEHAETFARQPEKIANRVYADRMGNGSEESGDGYRYRGRGFIQLTGKDNYQKIGDRIGLDLVSNPDKVSQDVEIALRVAADFWDSRNLNKYADKDDIRAVTRRINGGYNGLEDRQKLLARARAIWG